MIYLFSILIDVVFAIWAAKNKKWYFYGLYFLILLICSSIINTSWSQGLSRIIALYLKRTRHWPNKILSYLALTLLNLGLAYIITMNIVFSFISQFVAFLLSCIGLSTIIIFVDPTFLMVALKREEATKKLEESNLFIGSEK